jgi:hypothetical protein
MLKNIRLPVEIITYIVIMYFYSEYVVSREISNYILWPSTLVVIFLTWYVLNKIIKTIFKKLEL